VGVWLFAGGVVVLSFVAGGGVVRFGKVLMGACVAGLFSCGRLLAGEVSLVGLAGAAGLFSAGGVVLSGETRAGGLFFSGVTDGLLLFTAGSSLIICGVSFLGNSLTGAEVDGLSWPELITLSGLVLEEFC
jgi:hypothetical protein